MIKRGGGVATSILMIVGLLLYAILAVAWRGPAAAPRSNGATRPESRAQSDKSANPPSANAPSANAQSETTPYANITVFDALVSLRQAKAAVRTHRKERGCIWLPRPGRFRCGGEGWAFVGPHAGRSGGRAVRCLWMHPHAKGATTILRYPSVTVGDRLHARIALLKGSGGGKAVSLRVAVDGRTLVSISTTDEWRRGEADVDVPPGHEKAALRVEVDAPNNRWRMACVEVWMTGVRARSTRPPQRLPGTLPALPRQATPSGRGPNPTPYKYDSARIGPVFHFGGRAVIPESGPAPAQVAHALPRDTDLPLVGSVACTPHRMRASPFRQD